MPLLTKTERLIVRGRGKATPKQKMEIAKKLDKFQRKNTDPRHVEAVNSFISSATVVGLRAEKENPNNKNAFDQAYHREMDRLTRKAGLRV